MEWEEGCGIFMRTVISCSLSGNIFGLFLGNGRSGGGQHQGCIFWFNILNFPQKLRMLSRKLTKSLLTNSFWTKKLNLAFLFSHLFSYFVKQTFKIFLSVLNVYGWGGGIIKNVETLILNIFRLKSIRILSPTVKNLL